jgi:hypothetical protein
MITANIHRPVRATYGSGQSAHWVDITTQEGAYATVFFETAKAAQIVADAINAAIAKDAEAAIAKDAE